MKTMNDAPGLSDSLSTWLEWLAIIVIGLLATITAWFSKSRVDGWDDLHRSHAARLHALESTAATKDDVSGLYERINEIGSEVTQRVDNLNTQMTSQHTQLLIAIASNRQRDHDR
jgi:hypothetical protein